MDPFGIAAGHKHRGAGVCSLRSWECWGVHLQKGGSPESSEPARAEGESRGGLAGTGCPRSWGRPWNAKVPFPQALLSMPLAERQQLRVRSGEVTALSPRCWVGEVTLRALLPGLALEPRGAREDPQSLAQAAVSGSRLLSIPSLLFLLRERQTCWRGSSLKQM